MNIDPQPPEADLSAPDSPEQPPTDAAAPAGASAPAIALGRVCTVVAEHVEPVTRFDGSDLSETAAEQVYGVALELTLFQNVGFETERHNGPARLPSGTTKVSNASAFGSDLQSRLSRAQQEAPEAIKAWADDSSGSYRRLMPPSASFLSAPGAVGYEHTCSNCNGACEVTCPTCGGVGRNQCMSCHGAGRINCYSCYGNKKVNCSSCNGRGTWTEQVSHQSWNSSSNSYTTSYTSEYRSCGVCHSSGRVNCTYCDYDGKIQCNGCSGQGTIACGPCRATGRVDCSACLASGIQHVWGTVLASVQREETLSDAAEEATLKQLIHDKLPREDLPALGELRNVQHDVEQSSITTRHRLRLDVRRASIRALEHDFVVFGFGPDPRVFSFENIAGHLLAEDLVALEASVASAARWRRHGGSVLLDTTADFLRSELNMLIAEKVADLKASPQEAAEQVQNHFRGLVESDYVTRATTALRGALARLYGSELTEPAAYLCAITALVAGVLFGLGWPQPGPWGAALWSLGGAGIAWCVLEWQTCRRIAKRFEPAFAKRVLGQLQANGSVRRWRIGLALAAPLATWLVITGVAQLPFVRSFQAEQRDLAQSGMLLAQWSLQEQPDLRLRQYPARKMLDLKANEGDSRAQLILAWQLLLGAGGANKDVEAAGKLLDQAQARAGKDPLWQAAHAVYVLNQDSMPDAIRAAATELDQGAGRGLVEARFWLSRIYLEERSPLHDQRRGLDQLARAANQNHAHAALNLGQRLAAGDGVRRDVGAARRYLQRAAAAGLPEARTALATLR